MRDASTSSNSCSWARRFLNVLRADPTGFPNLSRNKRSVWDKFSPVMMNPPHTLSSIKGTPITDRGCFSRDTSSRICDRGIERTSSLIVKISSEINSIPLIHEEKILPFSTSISLSGDLDLVYIARVEHPLSLLPIATMQYPRKAIFLCNTSKNAFLSSTLYNSSMISLMTISSFNFLFKSIISPPFRDFPDCGFLTLSEAKTFRSELMLDRIFLTHPLFVLSI